MTSQDIGLVLPDRTSALAELGERLGAAGVSLEGGGTFAGVAHYLVDDAAAARAALERAGLGPVVINEVVTLRLRQAVPGQLGLLARRMADADVGIAVQYSDHDGGLVLVVPPRDLAAARAVATAWAAG